MKTCYRQESFKKRIRHTDMRCETYSAVWPYTVRLSVSMYTFSVKFPAYMKMVEPDVAAATASEIVLYVPPAPTVKAPVGGVLLLVARAYWERLSAMNAILKRR